MILSYTAQKIKMKLMQKADIKMSNDHVDDS